ncbi:MAG: glycosyltransferase family 2 protein [Burkholderiaceae bacterium]|nr:MAG: glycosyltransferase family 2 protein [Burkholderiaceae bacterium]
MLTAVIPTRNRPDDLFKAVASIRAQTRPPEELIIVDQSPGDESRVRIDSLMAGENRIRLAYIHDQRISGLVEAKHVAAQKACGEIVCFLEDDVVLEPEYLAEIELGFVRNPSMVGCCGIIANQPKQSFLYGLFFQLFHRGMFADKRVAIYRKFQGRQNDLIPSKMLSGGLSAWRREVFSVIPFDLSGGFFMLEDIDFSTRVARHFGARLYVNPNARLEHHWSPVNREAMFVRQRRKVKETILFYRKRKDWPWAWPAMAWLLMGIFLESGFKSVMAHSLSPLRNFREGIRDGRVG